MIYNSICNVIDKLGTKCILSEFNGNGACVVKGILQPVKNRARENGVDHTNAGLVDNSDYNFLFNLPKKNINFDNAIIFVYGRNFWLKEHKIFYFKNKPLYAQATLSPYEKE